MRLTLFFILFISYLLPASQAWSGELLLPSSALQPHSQQTVLYRPGRPLTGDASLSLLWVDALGRIVEKRQWQIAVDGTSEIPIIIDTGKAAVAVNSISVHLAVPCSECSDGPLTDDAETRFVIPVWDETWWDYQVLMWQDQQSDGYRSLVSAGVSGGRLIAKDRPLSLDSGPESRMLANNLRWYEENIATDFYASYHRWSAGKPVNWKFVAAKKSHHQNPDSLEPYIREPSLSDPEWLASIRERLTRVVQSQKTFRPLYYSLGDETGIADLAAYWDFDFSPPALAAFRRNLQGRYGNLEQLNQQWGSHFTTWEDVIPQTAAEALRRTDGNYSAWADFREWMDQAFAEALATGRDAIHQADEHAIAGIEGGQIPGWGGYDYARLAQAVDLLELYDGGRSVDLVHSLNTATILLTTSFSAGPAEKRRVWRELLHGNRGLILWDEASTFVRPDGTLGPRGTAAAEYLREIRGGIGALLINSKANPPAIAIHYSSASMRADWIEKQHLAAGKDLETATHPDRPLDNFTLLRQSACGLLDDIGQQYGFVSTSQIENGALERPDLRVLVLPRSVALSAAEDDAIRIFAQKGGVVIGIGPVGTYDEHGKRRQASAFSPDNGNNGVRDTIRFAVNEDLMLRYQQRPHGRPAAHLRMTWKKYLQEAGVVPFLTIHDEVTGKSADGIAVTVLKNGQDSIIGLLPSPSFEAPARPRTLQLSFGSTSCAYDPRGKRSLGCGTAVTVNMAPYEPTIIALSPAPIPKIQISLAETAHRGETTDIKLSRPEISPDAVQVFHIDVIAPDGTAQRHYGETLRSTDGTAIKRLALALNDPPGPWRIVVTDAISGAVQEAALFVH